jgi:hypothetical protein
MTAIRQLVAGLSGIALAGGIAVGASVALASSAHATCADEGGTFARGTCTVVTGGGTTTEDIAGPSGKVTNNPWTRVVTEPTTTTTYHGKGPGSQIGTSSTGGSTTINNPGGHEVDSVPGGGP